MKAADTWVIPTAELVVGSTLNFDLTDGQSIVLHKAGSPITPRLLAGLLKKNIHSVTVKGQPGAAARSLLMSFFDKDTVDATEQMIVQSEVKLQEFTEKILCGEAGDTQELHATVEQFLTQAIDNSSATFAVLAGRTFRTHPEFAAKMTSRSTLMALMGVTLGVNMDCSPEECICVGVSGLLHDLSLLTHPEWFDEDRDANQGTLALADFRNHAIESADMLRSAEGMNQAVLETIEQVHEQFDGSGFARGLEGSEILHTAKILNAADAYIQLTQPLFHSNRIVPSDALACLCHHAAADRFDVQIIRAFAAAMSLYPIGSNIELDDGTLAVVVNNNPTNPLEPVVRMLHGENEVIDLSDSERYVSRPSVCEESTASRLSKSQMDTFLWRGDIAKGWVD
jgi:HD-GYP domain-containing protein (c-di-GMP phosphodiesterase class II)